MNPDEDWRRDASCRGLSPDEAAAIFFPVGGGLTRAWRAEIDRYCGTCPVRAECLADAMIDEDDPTHAQRFGVRGGLTAPARDRLADTRRHRRAQWASS